MRMVCSPNAMVRHRGAERTPDEALDLLGATSGSVPLAGGALEGGTGQHGVLGSHPSLAASLLEAGHPWLDRRGAVDQGSAHPDETGALGIGVGATLEDERAHGGR